VVVDLVPNQLQGGTPCLSAAIREPDLRARPSLMCFAAETWQVTSALEPRIQNSHVVVLQSSIFRTPV
jgi:hypothetical protein